MATLPTYEQALGRFYTTGQTDWLDVLDANKPVSPGVGMGGFVPPDLADPEIAKYVQQQSQQKAGLLPLTVGQDGPVAVNPSLATPGWAQKAVGMVSPFLSMAMKAAPYIDPSAGLMGTIGRAAASPGEAAAGRLQLPLGVDRGYTSGDQPLPTEGALLPLAVRERMGWLGRPVRSTPHDQAFEPVFDLAGIVMGGSLPAAEKGALGTAGGRLSPEAMDAGRLRAIEKRNQGIPTGKDAPGWDFRRPDPVEGTPEWDAAVARSEARPVAPSAQLSPEDAAVVAEPSFVTPNASRPPPLRVSEPGQSYQSLLDSFDAPRNMPVTNRDVTLGSGDTSGSGQLRTAAVLGQRDPRIGLYSGLERAVDALPDQRAPGQQWLNTITNRPGVKPEELEWTGLRTFLEERRGQPVTKADVAQHLAENRVRLQESRRYDPEDAIGEDWDADVRSKYHDYQLPGGRGYRESLLQLPEKPRPKPPVTVEEVQRLAQRRRSALSDLRLAIREDMGVVGLNEATEVARKLMDNPAMMQGQYNGRLQALAEAAKQAEAVHAEKNALYESYSPRAASGNYKSPHWEEPNTLVHTRINEREMPVPFTPEEIAAKEARQAAEASMAGLTDQMNAAAREIMKASKPLEEARLAKIHDDLNAGRISGGDARRALEEFYDHPELKPFQDRLQALRAEHDAIRKSLPPEPKQRAIKSMHLEEIQSDWHQAGRKKGYQVKTIPLEIVEAEGGFKIKKPDGELVGLRGADGPGQVPYPTREQAQKAIDVVRRAAPHVETTGVPNAPFKKNWHELALKRALVEAAEKGFERLSWTPGKAQAERYSLSKQIDSIDVVPVGDGTLKWWPRGGAHEMGSFTTDLDGKIIKANQAWGDIAGKDASDLLGKDVANRGLASPDKEVKLTGVDLEFGGEGMAGFYDKMIPAAIEKLAKQWGVKAKKSETPAGVDADRYDLQSNGGSGWRIIDRQTNQPFGPTFRSGNAAEAWLETNGLGKQEPVWYIDIPEKMRADIKEKGFALFAGNENQRGVNAGLAANRERGLQGANEQTAAITAARQADAVSLGGPDYGAGRGLGGGGRSVEEAQASAARIAAGAKPIDGLPQKPLNIGGDWYVPGPDARIRNVAEQYMASRGGTYTPPQRYVPVDPERSTNIAKAFDEMQHAPDDPRVKASYEAMVDETVAQFNAMRDAGLKIEFIKPGQADPYALSPRQAAMDVADNNHLWVFPTDLGYGQAGMEAAAKGNPLLRDTGIVVDGRRLLGNDVFRIVHDYFGHLKEGHGFRAAGEDNAWRTHAAMYSDLARPAMTSETRGQNSWVNYGPHGSKNRSASSADTVYADQKIGLLPDWVWDDLTLGSGDTSGTGQARTAAMLATKERKANDPLWHGVSKVKLDKPVSEMESVVRQTTNAPQQVISPATLQGSRLLPVQGERTRAGGELLSVNGYKFDDPVKLEGGPHFMRDNMAAWASSGPIAQQVQNKVMAAGLKGDTVHGVTVAMGERSGDYAHMNAGAMARMVEQAPLTNAAKQVFDQEIRNKGVADWPGLDSPQLKTYLDQRDKGEVRKLFMKMVDTARYQKMGFPSAAEARVATTEPGLLNVPSGSSGFAIARMDPRGDVTPSRHTTYSHDIPGEYVGGLPAPVPTEVMFPKMSAALDGYLSQLTGYKPTKDYLLGRMPKGLPRTELADQQWVDSTSKHLEERGFTLGSGDTSGTGQARTAALLAARDDAKGITAYHGSPHDFDRFDMSKIGTGEGEQIFGHGLYFAEAEKTAQHYRDILSKNAKNGVASLTFDGKRLDTAWPAKARERWDDRLSALPEDQRKALINVLTDLSDAKTKTMADQLMKEAAPTEQRLYKELIRPNLGKSRQGGRMYEVGIDADPQQMLQFEKPYAEQPEFVQRALRDQVMDAAKRQKEAALRQLQKYPDGNRTARAFNDLPPLSRARAQADVENWEKLVRSEIDEIANSKTGKQLYTQAGLPAISPSDGYPKSTAALLDKGIPGLRYLDAMSRPLIEEGPKGFTVTMGEKSYGPFKTVEKATAEANKRATHNYVIFDDRLIRILRKYGIAVPGAAAAAGGMGALAPEEM